ncbi:MAG: acyl-CoA dehydrogenase [Rhodospirillales bacterium]
MSPTDAAVSAEVDIDHLRQWIGKTEEFEDVITESPMIRLSATLDRDDPDPKAGDPLPLAWNWLYFLPRAKQSDLKEDGHPKLGGFLPPVPYPRRMWAGSRFDHIKPLRVGEQAKKVSTILDVTFKEGRSGNLVFLLIQHQYFGEDGLCVSEEQDVVYRGPAPAAPEKKEEKAAKPADAKPKKAPEPPGKAVWTLDVHPDPRLLFRYSALTFNTHRIHYDEPYVTQEEGYPGLVVHGPLLATLLLDLARRSKPDAFQKKFGFRAMAPLFSGTPFTVSGEPNADESAAKLWITNPKGQLAMQSDIEFA